ncbi:MAG: hypothetical protein AAF497_04120 [Planctomycetota bacterium]
MSRTTLSMCASILFLTTFCYAQVEIDVEYDRLDGGLYITAPTSPNGDFEISAISFQSGIQPNELVSGFQNGSVWTSQYFNGSVQVFPSPAAITPLECFRLAEYDTGLSLDDFGGFEIAYSFPGLPGNTIFGDIEFKGAVPEPDARLPMLMALPLLLAIYRRRQK